MEQARARLALQAGTAPRQTTYRSHALQDTSQLKAPMSARSAMLALSARATHKRSALQDSSALTARISTSRPRARQARHALMPRLSTPALMAGTLSKVQHRAQFAHVGTSAQPRTTLRSSASLALISLLLVSRTAWSAMLASTAMM